jgi:membrane protease YdiL (CAAX protease family)
MNEMIDIQHEPAAIKTVNWARVAWFLGLTFGLTWLLDLVLYLNGGLTNAGVGLVLQFQMLLPAFSAMLLGVFFFKDGPIYYQTNHGPTRWFIYYFFLLTFLYFAGAIAGLIRSDLGPILSSILLIPNVFGLILLVVLRWRGGKNAFVDAGMAGGKFSVWILFGIALVAFYAMQSWFNIIFNLGTVVNLLSAFPQMASANLPPVVLLLSIALNAVVIGPFLGLIITFGEEYGWRGFLQSELVHLGRIRGVFILGIIWGIWHLPIIWMGYNYPGQPLLGSLFMVGYCVILAYFLAYAVFKSNGVWTAAYLHALNNQTLSFLIMAVVAPTSVVSSFGIGWPALLIGALVVLALLRDPIWKEVDRSSKKIER